MTSNKYDNNINQFQDAGKIVEDTEDGDVGQLEVVLRSQWGALEPSSMTPMELPVKEVFYSETETVECKSKDECAAVVKGIQEFSKRFQGLTDIQYHFLIGGDGRVYEGRGWYASGIRYPKNHRIPENLTGKCLEIAFIGSFKDKDPTDIMREAANGLIMYGIENNLLAVDEDEDNEKSGREIKETDKGN